MDRNQLWTLAQNTMQAFMPFYWREMRQAIADSGVPGQWFGLSLAHGSDPAPFTVSRYQEMAPYTARERFAELLDELVKQELLERVGEDAYRLTDLGRSTVEGIFAAAHEGLKTAQPLLGEEGEQLSDLLYRLVEATLEAPEPEEKWSMIYSRWTDPGEDASAAAKIDQYLTDLARFRDDAHIAAWKPLGVSGHAWEALTFIWRDQLGTAEELLERLPFRAHSLQDYQEALQDLAAKGWVVEEDGRYQLTDQGKQVREEAEEATDRHFYVGWSALSEDELEQLQGLLARAQDTLRAAGERKVWGLLGELSRAVPTSVQEEMASFVEDYGLNEQGFYFILLSALRLEPERISPARLAIRNPYTDLLRLEELITRMSKIKFLNSEVDGAFKLSEKGRTAINGVNHAFYTRLGESSVLSEEDLAQAEGLLGRIVDAILEAEEPDSKWCVTTTHRGHPSKEYSALAKIDQRLDDLNAFRDDAHLAAWRPYGVSGPAWEAFTFVWQGEVRTSEALADRLSFRGHTEEAYEKMLADLGDRGWVERAEDGYQTTEKGKALRQQAEEETDRLFFAPWGALNNVELAQLHDVLLQLRNGLQELADQDTDAA